MSHPHKRRGRLFQTNSLPYAGITGLMMAALLAMGIMPLASLATASAAGAPVAGQSSIRIVDLAGGNSAQPLQVYLDGALLSGTLGYGGSTAFYSVLAGHHSIQTINAQTHQVVQQGQYTLLSGHNYSLFMEERANGAIHPALVGANTSPIPAGMVRVRFANALPGGTVVKATLSGAPAFALTAPTGFSPYLTLPAGTYTLDIAPVVNSMAQTHAYASQVTLQAGQTYTLAATRLQNGTNLGNVLVSSIAGTVVLNTGTTPITVPSSTNEARLRIVDVAAGITTTMNVPAEITTRIDGSVVSTGLGFGGTSGYVWLSAGNHQVQMLDARTGKVLATSTISLAANSASTLFAQANSSGLLTPLVVADDVSTIPSGMVRVRFGNTLPSGTTAQAFLIAAPGHSGSLLFNPANASSVRPYHLLPAGTYRLQVIAPHGQTILSTSGIMLQAGNVYTIWATGTSTSATTNSVVITSQAGGQIIAATPTPVFVTPQGNPVTPTTPSTPAASSIPMNQAELRFINLLAAPQSIGTPGAPLAIYFDGRALSLSLNFGTDTGFAYIPAGTHHIQIVDQVTGRTVVNTQTAIAGGKAFSYVVEGQSDSAVYPLLVGVTIPTNTAQAQSGMAQIRFANAVPHTFGLKATLMPEVVLGTDQTGMRFGLVSFTGVSGYQMVPSGTYVLMVRDPRSTASASISFTADPGKNYTVFETKSLGQPNPSFTIIASS